MEERINTGFDNLDLFQFAVLNPQIAMLAFLKVGKEMAMQPEKIKEAQKNFLDRLMDLQKSFVKISCEKVKKDAKCIDMKYNQQSDKYEEKSDIFRDNPVIQFAQQFYDTTSNWMLETLDSFENIDPKITHSARFFLKQYIDMMSPKNFPFLNSDVLRETIDTHGENLKRGMEMLMNDLRQGSISTNDRSQYELGKNLAVTPGKVVYRNKIIELIQYEPTTKTVFATPVLFVPPWINKFYILDLTPENSFVKWAVDHGMTVFMVSWVNPDKTYREVGFDDYVSQGFLKALDIIYDITKEKSVHALGYCVGGTLIASCLAYLANAQGKIHPKIKVDSATLMTTLLDFQHAGDMAIFMAENYLDAIKAQMGEKGILDGKVMYNTFSALKANDMIWRYFVNSYMLGKKPGPHGILYWNSDPTNLTEAMQHFLSRDLYRDNLLKTGAMKLFGTPISIGEVNTPIYMISMKKDHLVPWIAAFDSMKLFQKNLVKFVVGGSGHVAGVVNPPAKHKYSYWINDAIAETAQQWIDTATEIAGSWWNNWFEWLKPRLGKQVAARQIENFLYDAPGKYVLNRLEEEKNMN